MNLLRTIVKWNWETEKDTYMQVYVQMKTSKKKKEKKKRIQSRRRKVCSFAISEVLNTDPHATTVYCGMWAVKWPTITFFKMAAVGLK